ncbi:MAG: methionine--tRNA ligase [Treponema sp.]|nr:MAG: methionine--tRNA ligase [Treponema sp.]
MKRKLVTSALPYVNNVPHLGNLIQVLSADVFARFCRLAGYETLYICGTDEYGTATETKAQLEGKTPRELCDYYHSIHADSYNWFNIAFDYFGRTSTPQQTEITQQLFLDLQKNGFITEHETEQPFCHSCGRFLADRYVHGECPSCGYDDARGDQCEHCGKLHDPVDLIKPRCATCGATPELKKTKHLYIDLPSILPQYTEWQKEASEKGQWAKNAVQMTMSWIRDGLHERGITRDLKWGIPVPKSGYEDKVFYVWFDAPIGYISITKCYADECGLDWKDWWLDQSDVELFQFIGKDNIPFHTVIFPSTLVGSGKNWTKLHHMSSTEYLNYETGKFSKSKGVGVFATDAKESGIPADMWRFYIFYNRPEKSDTRFTWKDFQERVNSELVGNLCNLVNRTLTFVFRYYDGRIPKADSIGSFENMRDDIKAVISNLRNAVEESSQKITNHFERANLRDAFHEIFMLSSVANKAFQDGEPWKTRETDLEFAESLLTELCYFIKDLMILVHPFMPNYADQVAEFLNIKIWSGNVFDKNVRKFSMPNSPLNLKNIGERFGLSEIKTPCIIFKTLDNKTVEEHRQKYAGLDSNQNDGKNRNNKQNKKDNKKMTTEKKDETPQLSLDEMFTKNIALKTAKIVAIEKHPDADKLYIEKLDDGSGVERTIISGLVPFLTEDELLGKTVIIADNLKPRKMRGVESQGMLLAASYYDADENEFVEVLEAPWTKPGTPVMVEGSAQTDNEESCAKLYAEKPASINADKFFAVPLMIKDYVLTVGEKKLLADNKEIKTKNVKSGEAG